MKYLLYCVFESHVRQGQRNLPGVGGQPMFVVGNIGLGAAASKVRDCDLTPNLPRVLDYEKVIETFYRERAVIPLRYGCIFDRKSQIIEFLQERGVHYAKLLKEIEGQVEMSVAVFFKSPEHRLPPALGSGTGYLAARRDHYTRVDRISREQERIRRQIHRLLSGLFVRSKTELGCQADSRLLSLHFLVPKGSVNRFRKVLHSMNPRPPVKILWSGPWPPHNFVS